MSAGNREPPRQLPLGLPHEPALGRDDFIVGPTNAEAMEVVDRWPDWPERGVLLIGPAGSGKTHLAAILSAASHADVIAASALSAADVGGSAGPGAAIIEDLHAGPVDQAALFHVLNAAIEHRIALLITSRTPPDGLRLTLPDLVSRLRAMHRATLGAPDDALLRRVLVKLFADRQLRVEPTVIDFILLRMERSLAAANAVAQRLDRDALAGNRAITRRLAGDALADMEARQQSLWPDRD